MPNKFTHQEGLVHIPVIIFFTGIAFFVIIFLTSLDQDTISQLNTQTSQNIQGVLIAKEGGDSDSSGSSPSDNNKDEDKSGSGTGGTSGQTDTSGSGSSGSTPKPESRTKTETSEGVRIETKTKDDRQKTEVRFGEGEKIKTKIEEGRTRIDVVSGGVKVRYEIRDGRVTLKAEREDGEQVGDEEIVKIVDRLDKTGIKVATEGGKLLVARNQIGALSNFPLQVDLATNQLIVTTPAGTKTVTILPDQAVQNMLAANVISRLGPSAIVEAARTGQVATVSGIIQLGIRNNIPVYEIPGIRDFRLLGFIPISAPVTAVVSAENGQLVETDQPLITTIVDLLSP